MKTAKRIMLMLSITALLCCLLSVAAFAAGSGDVAGAVESTWTAASGQIKSVVNKVVFPAIDMILAIFFFVKLGTAYFDYRKTGQFEWTAPVILFGCLIFSLDHRGMSGKLHCWLAGRFLHVQEVMNCLSGTL